LCTGKNNYLIHDHTGDFLPFIGVLLANNSWVGDGSPGCVYNNVMNGYVCHREDFGVMEYESLAADFNTRIMWPVYLRPDGDAWTSETNGWKEWEWMGTEPLNKRIGRFTSIIQLQKYYNVTMAAMPPIDMRFRLQRRLPNGNGSDWAVFKIYYPMPNSIQVSVAGVVIPPISLLDNNGQNPINTSVCGSNLFFYKNYTIHFAVTGDPACEVRVTLTNSIQLTARFAMDINDFFNTNGTTKFIDRMCALLQINDTSRLKVVGVYNGSIVIDSTISALTTSGNTTLTDAQQIASITATQNLLTSMQASGALSTGLASGGLTGLMSITATLNVLNPTTTNSPSSQTGMIIGIVLGVTVAICLAVVGSICYIRKRAKIGQIVNGSEVPMDSDGEKGVNEHDNKVISDENFSVMHFENKEQNKHKINQ
jgi:hypothetical protein